MFKPNLKTIRSLLTTRRIQTFGTDPSANQLPSFISGTPGRIDILHAESNDILFNLATEEYMYEHLNLVNPVLFIWRNTKTIIIGKH